MMNKTKQILFCIVAFFFSLWSFGQNITLSSQAEISVLTCGTSSELHSLFGHTGIRIKDVTNNIDWVYNYGAFDFRTPNFYGKFLKGNLLYFIGKDDFNSFLYTYKLENRSVWEQPLTISLNQKQAIFNELVTTYGTEKALYTYKFIDKNCTTLAVDLITKNTDIAFNLNIDGAKGLSNRKILNEYLKNDYFAGLGINLLFGAKTDALFNHIFLPKQFLESIASTYNNDKEISNEVITHYEAKPKEHSQLFIIATIAIICLFLGLLTYNKVIAIATFILLGGVSLFLLGMQFYSFHAEVHYNYNLLLINPLFLVAAYLLISNKIKSLRTILFITLICSLIYITLTLYYGYLFMVFPVVLMVLTSLIIQLRLYKKIQQ